MKGGELPKNSRILFLSPWSEKEKPEIFTEVQKFLKYPSHCLVACPCPLKAGVTGNGSAGKPYPKLSEQYNLKWFSPRFSSKYLHLF